MRTRSLLVAATMVTIVVITMSCETRVDSEATDQEAQQVRSALSQIPQEPHARVCSGGRLHCMSRIRVGSDAKIRSYATSTGFGPSDLASAYNLNTSLNPGATIALVDAYGYANAESDLAAYRSNYGLAACTVASGCLKIVNQNGATSPLPSAPPSGDDWTVETALDLDMASAACPNCKLLLVQANDDTSDGLYIAQGTAANLGASVISNSWGGPESSSDPATNYESYFNYPNVGIFVAAGDSGYDDGGQGPDYPGTSAHTTAVGGTTLTKSSTSRGWSEGAWSSGGSACSLSISKPTWQTNTVCSYKATADVSAVADPNTGLAVYNASNGGWIVVGGTSAASPLVASIFALTGNAKDSLGYAYSHASAFNDVTSGSNGSCGNVLCNAGAGWDGPTGVGTPIGGSMGTCTPTTCAAQGKTCGSISNGCGGNLNCGTCASGQTCSSSNVCVVSDAGTGASCGECTTHSSALASSCDSCTSAVCSHDSYCCNTAWDSICVSEVPTYCGSSTCSVDAGTEAGTDAGKDATSDGSSDASKDASDGSTDSGNDSGSNACGECTTHSGALKSSCDSCTSAVCSHDSYCCKTAWDAQCVTEVSTYCSSSPCGGSSCGECSTHSSGLSSSCDSCTNTVCTYDSYCCTTAWDSTCVSEVGEYCSSPVCK